MDAGGLGMVRMGLQPGLQLIEGADRLRTEQTLGGNMADQQPVLQLGRKLQHLVTISGGSRSKHLPIGLCVALAENTHEVRWPTRQCCGRRPECQDEHDDDEAIGSTSHAPGFRQERPTVIRAGTMPDKPRLERATLLQLLAQALKILPRQLFRGWLPEQVSRMKRW